ncbi:hypothetical protein [Gaiella sp.]|nr:hypothetical protein [Gaiella sp.]HEX5582974.1 hypothetical protein [Gaiella sp.]
MLPGCFFLGVGTGEALDEHVAGARWPETAVRLSVRLSATVPGNA